MKIPTGFRFFRQRLQNRLTVLVILAAIPVLVSGTYYINLYGRRIIEQQAAEQLRLTNHSIATDTATQLEFSVQIINQLALMPDISSMDAESQIPVLQAINTTNPDFYLIHTLDLNGMNVARSDGAENKDYHDRRYFQIPVDGGPVTFQVVKGKTSGEPALTIGTAIRDAQDTIVGVIGVAIDLTELSENVQASKVGRTGYTYIVDDKNLVVAHPDSAYTAELYDLGAYPPVAMMRQGKLGLIEFNDEEGQAWYAYTAVLDNHWGIIVQQQREEYLQTATSLRNISLFVLSASIVIQLLVIWLVIRQATRPIAELTKTAMAVAGGDLTQKVSVSTQDEIGILANTFNLMTSQLQNMVGTLEQRIADRTRALSTLAEVSRRLSTILDQQELVIKVVEQVKSAFGYYHVQIYLLDGAGQNFILAGGTGEAGKTMLAGGHRIPKGKGLVGRAAEINSAVLVSDVAQDPDWLPNPLLPETQSEAAVPIAIAEKVVGVLDVQHQEKGGLKPEDLELLQPLANQVAIALRNAVAYTEMQQRADREARITSIGQKIQSTTSVESALQVTIRELGRTLGMNRIRVVLDAPASTADMSKPEKTGS